MAGQNLHQKGEKTGLILRSAILFVNFFLIITALYQLKPASRSMILDAISVDGLPFVWIGSAMALLAFIAVYQQILKRFRRERVVIGTALLFMTMLVVIRFLSDFSGKFSAIGFYIFVDIFGVVMVEQFWSLANGVYSTHEGKRWYGLIGAGGLAGGAVGSGLAALLIRYTPLRTPDLLLVAAGVIGVIVALTVLMSRWGLYKESNGETSAPLLRTDYGGARKAWFGNRYMLLIAAALLMAQLISPLVEYLFMQTIEADYPLREARTAVLSVFFSSLSAVSIFINLVATPLLLRFFGLLPGLLAQPLVLAGTAIGFGASGSFPAAVIMKFADRGLAYSLTRTSRELLYVPVDALLMYQAKAWIDMFGYRTFKMLGALFLLLVTQWTAVTAEILSLPMIIVAACVIWAGVLVVLYREYDLLQLSPDVV